MDNQNLNDMNQNDISLNNQPNNNILNNATLETVQQVESQPVNQEVEVLEDLMDNNPVSFVKPVEVQKENPNELLNSVPKPDIMISSPTSNVVSTDDLIESYVGKNYEKISRRFYNLSAFFFGPTYFLYRKMYLYGIILEMVLLAASIGLTLINPFITLIVYLLIAILSCLLFNKIYISFCKSSIERIKKNNKTKSISELNKICSKKGGTSLLLAIIVSIIVSGALTTIIQTIMPDILLDLGNKFMDTIEETTPLENDDLNNDDNTIDIDDNFDNINYNGTTSYKEDVLINNLISIGFIQIFSPTELNSDYKLDYQYKTDPNNDNSKCNFAFGVVNNYISSTEMINEMAKYYKTTDNITTITTSSNLEWDSFVYEGNLTKVHYNAIKNDNNVYLFTYEISSAANETTCEAFYNGILNSIQFK